MGMETPILAGMDVRDLTLSEALRERTAPVHHAAERSGIINDILRQKAGRESYALLLRNFLPAYESLETALRARASQPILRAFAVPALFRAPALRNDLIEISGKDFERSLPLLDSGVRYARGVDAAAQGDGMRLLSHAYVRYFGDLSGGQVLKKLLGRSMDLPAEALSVYEFPGIDDHRAFKNELRAALDSAADVADPKILIEEALSAFEHNIAISAEVQAAASRGAIPG